MLRQTLFLALYFGLSPAVLFSPFVGVLIYNWVDYLEPSQVYSVTLLQGNISFTIGALTFFAWLIREKKTIPRPLPVLLLMAALLFWANVTSFYALAPDAAGAKWDRTVKVIGFAILTAQMASTRERLEALVWTLVLGVTYYSVPSAIKVIVSGGSGGIGTGQVVAATLTGCLGDRTILSVVLAMTLPLTLYLARHSTLFPPSWLNWVRPAMLCVAASVLVSLIGTFARTAVVAGGAALFMLAIRSQRKIVTVPLIVATTLVLLAIAPGNWFERMETISDYQNDASAMHRIMIWKWAWQMALSHPIVGGGFHVFVLDASALGWERNLVGEPAPWLEAHNIFFETVAEQGFPGLALFCCLIFAIYRSCASVQKRVRGRADLAWSADLACATQVALVAFVAGGNFVSIATSPFLYLFAGITVGTRNLVERELVGTSVSQPTRIRSSQNWRRLTRDAERHPLNARLGFLR